MIDSESFALGTFSFQNDSPWVGAVWGEMVVPLNEFGIEAESLLSFLDDWSVNFEKLCDTINSSKDQLDQIKSFTVNQLKVFPPVNLPRQVFCSGANYRKHVIEYIVISGETGSKADKELSKEELRKVAEKMMDDRAANGFPYMFMKPVTSITGAFDEIVIPKNTKQADWELELVVVIGKTARHVSREVALDHVAGYTIGNDISSRDLIFRKDAVKALGTDWVSAKGSPTFLPLGPYLKPATFVGDPQNLQIRLTLNGEVMQDESTSDMIFNVARQIEYLSSLVRLLPGDIICTGSPAGNAISNNKFLKEGDVLEGTISGLGTQRNQCIEEK